MSTLVPQKRVGVVAAEIPFISVSTIGTVNSDTHMCVGGVCLRKGWVGLRPRAKQCKAHLKPCPQT